jgi:hypothetical protein
MATAEHLQQFLLAWRELEQAIELLHRHAVEQAPHALGPQAAPLAPGPPGQ